MGLFSVFKKYMSTFLSTFTLVHLFSKLNLCEAFLIWLHTSNFIHSLMGAVTIKANCNHPSKKGRVLLLFLDPVVGLVDYNHIVQRSNRPLFDLIFLHE